MCLCLTVFCYMCICDVNVRFSKQWAIIKAVVTIMFTSIDPEATVCSV